VPASADALGCLILKRQVDEFLQHVFTDPVIPVQIASWTFSFTSSGNGLADVLDCSMWLKYRSSTGGPPFLVVLPTAGREPPPHVPVDFHNIRDATRSQTWRSRLKRGRSL
jgi:hypothetical protein